MNDALALARCKAPWPQLGTSACPGGRGELGLQSRWGPAMGMMQLVRLQLALVVGEAEGRVVLPACGLLVLLLGHWEGSGWDMDQLH